jgi:hypothetical protein
MTLKLHRLVLADGSDYFRTRLCTASSSDGLQYKDEDGVIVERMAEEDVQAMETFLKFLYEGSLDESLPVKDILTVLKVLF